MANDGTDGGIDGTDGPGWWLQVDPQCDGWRLDRFLAERIGRLSRARAARLTVLDLDAPARGPLKKSATLRKGQRLFARRPSPDAGISLPEPTILHADETLLVIDKPAGWAAHPTASRHEGTITSWLGRSGYEAHEPVHRLDVETSGVMAVARTPAASRFLQSALSARAFEKIYLAIVVGEFPVEETRCDLPLGFDATSEVRLKMGRGDLSSSTLFRRLGYAPTTGRSLVEARPLTGRQHQIRVHLALLGWPIVGDKLYGPDERLFLASLRGGLSPEDLERLGHPRHALHAWRLTLPRPDGDMLTCQAPFPAELSALLPAMPPVD